MKRSLRIVLPLLIAFAGASCSTPKTLNYLQDMVIDSVYIAKRAPELKIQPSDKLAIRVYSSDPQLSAPFNSWSATGDGGVNISYVVDKTGYIDFPILGCMSKG